MPLLNLGVVDIPYSQAPGAAHRYTRANAKKGVTTGDVAEWLEDKYHVMEVFAETHNEDLAHDLEESLAGALEDLLVGAPAGADAFGSATSKIEDRFKQFLSLKEMDALGYPGVPTQASLRGVSHRFKRPYAKRPPRPSFIDTGLYQSSAKAWVE